MGKEILLKSGDFLLVEENYEVASMVVEAQIDKINKRYYLEGVMTQAGIVNGNKRKYLLDEMISCCNDYQPKIKDGRAVGELKHPNSADIDPERIAVKVLSYERDGETSNFIGKSEVLPYGLGSIIRGHMDYGIKVATSSRGVGKLDNKGDFIQVSKFKLTTPSDVVWTNSAPLAIPNYNIQENLLMMVEESLEGLNDFYSMEVDISRHNLKNASRSDINKVVKEEYERLMNIAINKL